MLGEEAGETDGWFWRVEADGKAEEQRAQDISSTASILGKHKQGRRGTKTR